jgi:hypothetical protein
MFPDFYTVVQVRREQIADRLREVERDRLVRQVLAGRSWQERFHCRALAWMGCQMVAWGVWLQKRYGVVAEVPVLQTVNHNG